VTASGEGDEGRSERSSRMLGALFGLGVAALVPSAGRKMTLIFFSWIADLFVCSICDHYGFTRQFCPTLSEGVPYKRSNVRELLIWADKDRLYKELVATFGIWSGIFLHRL
jgi:hypothetical protein